MRRSLNLVKNTFYRLSNTKLWVVWSLELVKSIALGWFITDQLSNRFTSGFFLGRLRHKIDMYAFGTHFSFSQSHKRLAFTTGEGVNNVA